MNTGGSFSRWLQALGRWIYRLGGGSVIERALPRRDAHGRFLRDRPYAPGPAEELGLHPRLNDISKIPFDFGDGSTTGPNYRERLRQWTTRNMDQWLDERRANLGMVFKALERADRAGVQLTDDEVRLLLLPARRAAAAGSHAQPRSRGAELWSPGTGY